MGKLASTVDLLSLAASPQGASSWELTTTDRKRGAVPNLSRDRGDIEALPLGLYMCPRSVEVGSWDFGSCGSRATSSHLGAFYRCSTTAGYHQSFKTRPKDPIYFITQGTWEPNEGIPQHMVEMDAYGRATSSLRDYQQHSGLAHLEVTPHASPWRHHPLSCPALRGLYLYFLSCSGLCPFCDCSPRRPQGWPLVFTFSNL